MLKTLNTDLDSFLGGYKEGNIGLIYGPAGSGKTTLCLMAAASALSEGKNVLYIDTENSFSVERFRQITGSNFEDFIKQIRIAKPDSFGEQINITNKLVSEKKRFDLIIIDTITYFHRKEIGKNENLDKKMRWHIRNIRLIAKKGLCVLATSQVYEDIKEGKFRCVSEKVISDSINLKIRLEKEPVRKLCVSEREFLFEIVNEGIKKMS